MNTPLMPGTSTTETPRPAAATPTTARMSSSTMNSSNVAVRSVRPAAVEVAAAGHATRCPPVGWPAARVRRERADAVAVYRAEIALRARHSRVVAIRAGIHLGRVPYGYTLTPDRRLVPAPAPAQVVESIYRWRVERAVGVAEIVRRLAADPDRFPPPPPGRPGATVGWTPARVAAILTDSRHAGRAVLRPARCDPATGWTAAVLTPTRTHPALVDDHAWRAAQLPARRPLPVRPDTPTLTTTTKLAPPPREHAGRGR
jgi:Recombinase